MVFGRMLENFASVDRGLGGVDANLPRGFSMTPAPTNPQQPMIPPQMKAEPQPPQQPQQQTGGVGNIPYLLGGIAQAIGQPGSIGSQLGAFGMNLGGQLNTSEALDNPGIKPGFGADLQRLQQQQALDLRKAYQERSLEQGDEELDLRRDQMDFSRDQAAKEDARAEDRFTVEQQEQLRRDQMTFLNMVAGQREALRAEYGRQIREAQLNQDPESVANLQAMLERDLAALDSRAANMFGALKLGNAAAFGFASGTPMGAEVGSMTQLDVQPPMATQPSASPKAQEAQPSSVEKPQTGSTDFWKNPVRSLAEEYFGYESKSKAQNTQTPEKETTRQKAPNDGRLSRLVDDSQRQATGNTDPLNYMYNAVVRDLKAIPPMAKAYFQENLDEARRLLDFDDSKKARAEATKILENLQDEARSLMPAFEYNEKTGKWEQVGFEKSELSEKPVTDTKKALEFKLY